ncbi:zinc ribbon domain-containing protein [Rhodohalobacter sulfatireducens]|uniref:Zinc ribbon domain-containing protein n=1 Tax=Rhodohalobacter sulfatireducens TaxID=2911366 RepID=A0ABS9KGI7_9BACT|nr:zinc ribbon domain-containing protein [Rhodohalobacter sulfatireducens]
MSNQEKTKECPGCAMDVPKDADVCPICGYEFPKQPLSVKIGVWILIFLLLLWYFF